MIAPDPAKGTKVPVYNLEPEPGEPARFGFVIAVSKVVFLETEVAWESDFHESFTITLPNPSAPFSTLKSRLVNFGQAAGNSKAHGRQRHLHHHSDHLLRPDRMRRRLYSTWFRAESYGEPNPTFPAGSTPRGEAAATAADTRPAATRSRSTRRRRRPGHRRRRLARRRRPSTTNCPSNPPKKAAKSERATEGSRSRTCARRKSRCRRAWA